MANLSQIVVGDHAKPVDGGQLMLYMNRETFMYGRFTNQTWGWDGDIFHQGLLGNEKWVKDYTAQFPLWGISDTYLWGGEGHAAIEKSYANTSTGLYWHNRYRTRWATGTSNDLITGTNVKMSEYTNLYKERGHTGFMTHSMFAGYNLRRSAQYGFNMWSFTAPWEGFFQWYAGQSVMWWSNEITVGESESSNAVHARGVGGATEWWDFEDANGLHSGSAWNSKVTGNNNHYLTPPIRLRKGGKIYFTCANDIGEYKNRDFFFKGNTKSAKASYNPNNTGGAGSILAFFTGPPQPEPQPAGCDWFGTYGQWDGKGHGWGGPGPGFYAGHYNCNTGIFQNRAANSGTGCWITNVGGGSGYYLGNNNWLTKYANPGGTFIGSIYSPNALVLDRDVDYLDCEVTVSATNSQDVAMGVFIRQSPSGEGYEGGGNTKLYYIVFTTKAGGVNFNNKKFSFRITPQTAVVADNNHSSNNVMSFKKGTKTEFGLILLNHKSSTTTNISRWDICITAPKPAYVPKPNYARGSTNSMIRMSDLAIRGGAGTYRFPSNWYGYTQRNGQTDAGVQGWMGWKYGYTTPGTRAVTWYNPKTDARSGHFFKGAETFPFMNYRGEVHPHTGHLNVIRWKCVKGGRIRMYGVISDTNLGGGNGVLYWIAKMKTADGQASAANVAEYVVNPDNTFTRASQGRIFNTTTNCKAGDCYYLVIGPNTDPTYDTTQINWNMFYEETNFTGTKLSLREMTEDMARYQVIMPNYRPSRPGLSNAQSGTNGQSLALQTKFSDRGELSTIPMSQWVDTTFVPDIQRTAASHDTAYYANQGNGMLQIRMRFHPGGAQWWSSGGTVTTSQLRLINLSPPSGVSFSNHVERDWTYAGAGSGGAQLMVKFDGLVGGLYGVEGKIQWTTPNGGNYNVDISDTGVLPSFATFVQRGLNSYAI